ncbi:MAG: Ni/Fe hydrogenase subunit alpha [Candidatus Heimdallarchaeota archaeon]|nr:Ni/Fe hydrogenase subunit alpha [Candidatus Heimdallarchaeota archaeon]
MTKKTYHIEHICRVEGHGNLLVEMDGETVKKVEMQVVEGARFFEGFAVGRKYDEAINIMSRICAICSVSHQLSAVSALERSVGIKPSDQVQEFRVLLDHGENLQSHILHVGMLALPDFLGYDGAIQMAADYPNEVKLVLRMKRIANDLQALIGGREIHPVNIKPGGFGLYPTTHQLEEMKKKLLEFKDGTKVLADLYASLEMPQYENKTEQVAVYDGKSYPFLEGDLKCLLSGKVQPADDYKKDFIVEDVRAYSTAKFSTLNGDVVYYVSPLARVNINHDFLTDDAKALISQFGLKLPSFNPFANNLARVIELMHCVDEAIAIVDKYIETPPKDDNKKFKIRAGTGTIATEAPRGLLNHSYDVNHEGVILRADVITPTAHNVNKIEDDAKKFAPLVADKKDEEIELFLNMLVRSYDPCISCSAHAMQVTFNRT